MAFHPYPQLIPQVFNPGGFGPPRALTRASTWPWVDHSASGLDHATHNALFRLAFATTTPHGLISRRNTNSQAHSSKGTLSPQKAPTACKHTVSGTISLPSRGTFHHSLTVLIRYRSSGSIQAYQVVLADSHEISRAPCYSGERHTTTMTVSSTGLTPPTVWHSPPVRLPPRHSAQGGDPRNNASHNPDHATLARYHTQPV